MHRNQSSDALTTCVNRRKTIPLLLFAILTIAVVGCSSDSNLATIEGTVTLDGAPLEAGLIRFVPVDGQSPTADATIAAGKFVAQVPRGEKSVAITAPKVVGKRKLYNTPDSPTIDVVEELLPPRYNTATELKLSIDGATRDANFNLTSESANSP